MTPEQIWLELTNLSSNSAFWQVLGSEQFALGCSCHNIHEHQINNAKKAQIIADINKAGENIFDQPDKDDVTLIFALLRMQDQIAVGKNFTSKRTLDFARNHEISFESDGIKISGEPLEINNAAQFLREKYSLNNTGEKIAAIRQSRDQTVVKLQNILDVGWQDFVNEPLVRNAPTLYQNIPSLATVLLVFGTTQMILRSFNQQESADEIRDNVGAASEMAAFFVIANLLLENFSHSFILAAPAFGATLAYDKIRQCLVQENAEVENQNQTVVNLEPNLDSAFSQRNFVKENEILEQTVDFLQRDELWSGLRKWQLKHQENTIENHLRETIPELILGLQQQSVFADSLLKKYGQDLSDSLHLLKSLSEVYAKDNASGEINQLISDFVETFAHSGILLNDPSKNAREAGFCCRSHHQLVGFNERVSQSLPHLPSGSQVALAGLVVGGIYAARQIYQATTGEEEIYSSYVTNFPDHLFSWLQLGQMYQNLGGDASLSQSFRDFFASFNLAENSTHLGIAIAPIVAYSQLGSKMFEGINHRFENLAAYLNIPTDFWSNRRANFYAIHPENSPQITDVEMAVGTSQNNENLGRI